MNHQTITTMARGQATARTIVLRPGMTALAADELAADELAADELAAAEADERAALAELAALAPAPRQAGPRAMAEVRALAVLATCGQCWARHREPCTVPPEAEPGSLHLARYDRAARRGLISGADMAAVLSAAGQQLLSPAVLVYPSDGANGACPGLPRNAKVDAGNRAPGGRDNPVAQAPGNGAG